MELESPTLARAIGHIATASWGRASTPEIVDKPGRPRFGRQLNGKPAMKQEITAAVRLQRVARGALARIRLRSEELEGVRYLHGGLQHSTSNGNPPLLVI